MKEPINSVNTVHLLLDSRYRTLNNDGKEFFSWGHINNWSTAQGTVNSIGNIRDIISVSVHLFKIPNVKSANTPYGLISLTIDEFSAQSTIAHENTNYHFLGTVLRDKVTPEYIPVVTKEYSKGEYKFNKPITTIETLTLRFGSPLQPVIFDKDRLSGSITYGNPTLFTFSEPHNLLPLSIVYPENFTTNNPSYESGIITEMNNPAGLTSTIISPIEISVPVDTSTIVMLLTGTIISPSVSFPGTVNCIFKSKIITGIGTNFTTEFLVNDYIQINNNSIYKIVSIKNNSELTIEKDYDGVTGIYSYRKTSNILTGIGTLFKDELSINDTIIINDGDTNPTYKVKKIENNTSLILNEPYNGLNGMGFSIEKNNSKSSIWTVFFATKRFFIELDMTYLSK